MKLIISSATLDAEKFSRYFNNADVFYINERMFNVEIEYKHSMIDYVYLAFITVKQINENESDGDILVFLSSKFMDS